MFIHPLPPASFSASSFRSYHSLSYSLHLHFRPAKNWHLVGTFLRLTMFDRRGFVLLHPFTQVYFNIPLSSPRPLLSRSLPPSYTDSHCIFPVFFFKYVKEAQTLVKCSFCPMMCRYRLLFRFCSSVISAYCSSIYTQHTLLYLFFEEMLHTLIVVSH